MLMLGQKNGSFCTLNYDTHNESEFYYGYPIDDNNMVIKYYNSSYDFDNFDPYNTGDIVKTTKTWENLFSEILPDVNQQIWNIHNSYFHKNYSRSTITTFTPFNRSDQSYSAVCGISMSATYFSDLILELSSTIEGRIAVLTGNDRVFVEDMSGLVDPLKISGDRHQFPKLSELGQKYWLDISNYSSHLVFGKAEEISINDTTLVIIKVGINTRNPTNFTMIAVFPLDQFLTLAFYPTTIVFICCIAVIFVLCMIFGFLLRKNDIDRKIKLSKHQPMPESYQIEPGAISRSIHKLRKLQLCFPNDLLFNKIIDIAASNLAETKEKHFSVQLCHDKTHDFCHYLVPHHVHNVKDPVKHPYKSWKFFVNYSLKSYQNIGTLKFDIESHVNDPVPNLILLIVTILSKEDLLFKEFDPDSLIHFMINFASRCCKDNIQTAHSIFYLYYLVTNPFKHWIMSKIDLFCLFFAAFVNKTDCKIAFDNPDDSFSQSTEDPWDVSDETQSEMSSNEEMSNLQKHLTAFNDDESIIHRNIKLIFELLSEFIPDVEHPSEIKAYFVEIVTQILFALQDKKQFSLLGEFCIRVESPDFSVINVETGDKVLFMKSLIKLCDYSAYWSPIQLMEIATNRLSKQILMQSSNDPQLVAIYHYELALKIVKPWISVFSNFNALEKVNKNINTTIYFWERKI